MKKKILGIVLAFCLMIPCMFMVAGCGDTAIYAGTDLTLAEALTQVETGGTIKLDADIVLDAELRIAKKVTIDLNGYTISNTVDIWNDAAGENETDSWSLISVRANGDLTIKNGTLAAKENDCYALDVRYGGKLTIESGEYVGNVSAVYVVEGELNILGGKFNIQQLDNRTNDSRYTINCNDANHTAQTAIVKISGGQFANYNPAGSTSEYPTINFLEEGYVATADAQADENGDIWYTVTAE
ncbi:MAG: hypothetical protein E7376_01695 [Clostridiales bacterium]|nr:hypothetical protein [Clostridiales bacterium]